ncbi:MAG TPA: hypothetical protein VGA50_00610, partial [Kiloniellales bacterium]
MSPPRPSPAPRPAARTAAAFPRRLAAAAWSALLLAACGYPDAALMAPQRAPAQSTAPVAPAAAAATAGTAERPDDFGLGAPFVVIRFGPEPVDYEEALAGAVAA